MKSSNPTPPAWVTSLQHWCLLELNRIEAEIAEHRHTVRELLQYCGYSSRVPQPAQLPPATEQCNDLDEPPGLAHVRSVVSSRVTDLARQIRGLDDQLATLLEGTQTGAD